MIGIKMTVGIAAFVKEGWSDVLHPSKYYEAANRLDREGKLKIILPMTSEVEPWQVGLENERGSIKVGKWADFVLADRDVFSCPVTDIRKTKVVSA